MNAPATTIKAKGINALTVSHHNGVTTIQADCTPFSFDKSALKAFASTVQRFADTGIAIWMASSNARWFACRLDGGTLHAGETLDYMEREIPWPELREAIRALVPASEWE